MKTSFTSISAGGLTLVTLSTLSFAQGVTPPPRSTVPPTPQATLYDPQQLPAIHGEFERLTLTARGDIDGFILKDGTEVKTAPALSTQIAIAMKPGDRVTVHGLKAAALPLVSAVSVTDEATQRTVSDSGVLGAPPVGPAPPPAPRVGAPLPPGAVSETSGRVRMVLHGPQGEMNGVLLESGSILRFPPDQAMQLTILMQPRQTVVAEGTVISNALGTVVDVQRIGGSRDRLVAIGPAGRLRDNRGPPGPGRRPPPPPDGAPQPPPVGAVSGPLQPTSARSES